MKVNVLLYKVVPTDENWIAVSDRCCGNQSVKQRNVNSESGGTLCGCGLNRCNQTAEGDDLIHVHCAQHPLSSTLSNSAKSSRWAHMEDSVILWTLVNKSTPCNMTKRYRMYCYCEWKSCKRPQFEGFKISRCDSLINLVTLGFSRKSHAGCSTIWCG